MGNLFISEKEKKLKGIACEFMLYESVRQKGYRKPLNNN